MLFQENISKSNLIDLMDEQSSVFEFKDKKNIAFTLVWEQTTLGLQQGRQRHRAHSLREECTQRSQIGVCVYGTKS